MSYKLKVLLTGVVMLFAACGGGHEQAAVSDTVTDDYGRSVVVPTQPQRVVSLSPAVTEIIYALGAQELLVGRTDFCEYPPEAQDIPSIGGISNLNIESILSLNPDLVISGSMVGKKVTDQMDQMGVPMVCVIEKPKFEALFDNIAAIGRLVGKEREADSLNALMRERANALVSADTPNNDAITQSHNNATTPKVYYVVGFGPSGNFTAGGNTFINDIIRMAGGRNIAEDIDGWSYSLEALMHADPDYIMIRREDSATFCTTPPYNRLTAIKKNQIIAIESGTIDLQVPRNIDAIRFISQQLSR